MTTITQRSFYIIEHITWRWERIIRVLEKAFLRTVGEIKMRQ